MNIDFFSSQTLSILSQVFPLFLITLTALISEYAGRLALFIEGLLNLSAFLCYTFTVLLHNPFAGIILSMVLCTLLVFILERISNYLKANIFITALAFNIFFLALTSFLSSKIFNTRGVLYSNVFSFSPQTIEIIEICISLILCAALILLLKTTSIGLKLKITGSNPEVLHSRGISVSFYKSLSWIIVALASSFCGSFLSFKLSSFVPMCSGGRGWLCLAAVFLGCKKTNKTFIAVLIFSVIQFLSTNIQNIAVFKNLPSGLLLSFPYIISLCLLFFFPGEKNSSC